MTTKKIMITMDDIRACGGCAPGARTFFRRYGLDFKAFVKNKCIDADEFRKCNNAITDRIVAYKENLVRNGGDAE